MLEEIVEHFPDSQFMVADGFDDAIIGFDQLGERLVYSTQKVLSILVAEGMSMEDALEHFDFNIRGAYVGENTPVWCDDSFDGLLPPNTNYVVERATLWFVKGTMVTLDNLRKYFTDKAITSLVESQFLKQQIYEYNG